MCRKWIFVFQIINTICVSKFNNIPKYINDLSLGITVCNFAIKLVFLIPLQRIGIL